MSSSAKIRQQIDDAFEGINELTLYACRNAIKPGNLNDKEFGELLGRLSVARTHHMAETLDSDKEVQFFQDFRTLTAAFTPVTIGSLRDTASNSYSPTKRYYFFGPQISKTTAIVRRFSVCAVLALIFLLYAQVVWVRGTAILTQYSALEKEFRELKIPAKKDDQAKKTPPADQGTTSSETSDFPPQESDPGSHETSTKQLDLEVRARAFLGQFHNWIGMAFARSYTGSLSTTDSDKLSGRDLRTQAIVTKESVAIVLNVYSAYILPLLYGLMGACCYMLRQIILEVRQRTYRSDAEMSYWVRLFLGVLSGLAIGWFLRSGTDGTGGNSQTQLGTMLSLTPLALSFLAGYSVELLFSAMDRLVEAFGSTSQKSPS